MPPTCLRAWGLRCWVHELMGHCPLTPGSATVAP